LEIRRLTKSDFDYLVSVLDRWWGGPAGQRALPVFLYELGQHALVADDGGEVVGFLLGFLTPASPPTGYVHLVGIHPECRRRGVGQELYRVFADRCLDAGATSLKAIASVGDEGSVAFHRALGFDVEEVRDYAGPGRGRLVFRKPLSEAASPGVGDPGTPP